jgi:hypothetical protein
VPECTAAVRAASPAPRAARGGRRAGDGGARDGGQRTTMVPFIPVVTLPFLSYMWGTQKYA